MLGVARGITVVINNGLITDMVLYWAEQAVSGLGGVGFILITYLRPPATWWSPPTRPPTNGLVNLATPASAVVMGGLAIARVGYGIWWPFVWPVLVLLAILSMLVLAVGVLI